MWARRADIQPVLDDASSTDRVAYCVDNPRKAGLVAEPEHWPGLNLCFGLSDSDQLHFEYFDTTAWNRARRPDDIEPFFEAATLELSPLPALEGRERDAYAKDVRRWVAERVRQQATEAAEQPAPQQPTLGVDKVVGSAFDQRPKHPKRGRRPYCFGSAELRHEHYQQSSALLQVYGDKSERFRLGHRQVQFPPGTYPPPLLMAD